MYRLCSSSSHCRSGGLLIISALWLLTITVTEAGVRPQSALVAVETHADRSGFKPFWKAKKKQRMCPCDGGAPQPPVGHYGMDFLNVSADVILDRRFYQEQKLGVDIEALRTIGASPKAASHVDVVSARSSPKRVAFLFIAIDGLDWESLWDKFFAAAPPDHYRIYIHRAGRATGKGSGPSPVEAAKLETFPLNKTLALERYGTIEVPRVLSSWCALFGAQTALLAHALQDPENEQFVMLSESSIPVKSFAYVYHQLAEVSPKTSKFCFAEPSTYKYSTYEVVKNEVLRTCIYKDYFRNINPRTPKHHQWIVLSREHAQVVVGRGEKALLEWGETWMHSAPDSSGGEGCSDECVPATALLQDVNESGRSSGNIWVDLTRLGVEQTCTTFVVWRHCTKGTELEVPEPIGRELRALREFEESPALTDEQYQYYFSLLQKELNGYPAVFDSLTLDYLERLVNSGFMFARKFAPAVKVETATGFVPLAEILPQLWDRVHWQTASQNIWTRMETIGQPKAF